MGVVWWALGGLATLGAVFVAGMRWKWAPVTTTVRRMNKRFMNPRQLRTAGGPGAYAGIVRHVGRTSSRPYETPIGIEETPDGFAVALVYGTGADWLKNVLAAGAAEFVHEGVVHRVGRPRVVGGAEAIEFFGDADRRTFAAMNVDEFLLVDRVD